MALTPKNYNIQKVNLGTLTPTSTSQIDEDDVENSLLKALTANLNKKRVSPMSANNIVNTTASSGCIIGGTTHNTIWNQPTGIGVVGSYPWNGIIGPGTAPTNPNTITISGGGVINSVFTTNQDDVSKELEGLCINVEKYDQLDGTLKKMADEFIAAVEKNTTLTGKYRLYFNTLQTYEVLISKDAFERIRKLNALAGNDTE